MVDLHYLGICLLYSAICLQVVEAVTKVFVSFAQAFRKKESKTEDEIDSSSDEECFLFEVTMEIKEKSNETSNSAAFELVPRQKGIFKLRSNIEKKVVVSVQQLSQNSCKLSVERCFGMLVSPGRNGKSMFKNNFLFWKKVMAGLVFQFMVKQGCSSFSPLIFC